MDAPEDDHDIALQRVSADLVADLDRSLARYLDSSSSGGGGGSVRVGETTRMTSTLLDPFQEFPQLLDPHLAAWLPALAEAYLAALQARRRQQQQQQQQQQKQQQPSSSPPAGLLPPSASHLLEPLTTGICRLLYTFCKVRGEKVVVRFLSVEARHLEVLLGAFEDGHAAWAWEERYVVLLWLSHLALAPFDLASMSSLEPDEVGMAAIPNFAWPEGAVTPTIAARVVPLAVRYLAAPGKERDAARALLVRLAVRRDMQEIGLLERLVAWALASLRGAALEGEEGRGQGGGDARTTTHEPAYFYIGVLSFLAGVAESVPSVAAISDVIHNLPPAVLRSALARKMVIKVMRCVATVVLRRTADGNENEDGADMAAVEPTIGYLLDAAADGDTPVRLAASKALSVVALRLPPDGAVQVVEAVLDALNRNVLWTTTTTTMTATAPEQRVRDTSAVDPLEWHGLTLTLAHLLYRRSPPAEALPAVVDALLLGLAFEKRSAAGTFVGANVRDAACFGVWALARRYTTAELLAVKSSAAAHDDDDDSGTSTIQRLAVNLVVAACLDSAGNIRRGASAALQELIGRHPNTVERGIELVQAVDYHAVALRARAVHHVALAATRLSPEHYGRAILQGLLRWRGVGDPDAAMRRAAAASFGAIVGAMAAAVDGAAKDEIATALATLREARAALQARQIDELHGLLLMLAAVLDQLVAAKLPPGTFFDETECDVEAALKACATATHRKPEVVAEAACRLFVAAVPVFLIAPPSGVTSLFEVLLPAWLLLSDRDAVSAVAEAAHALFVIIPTLDERRYILSAWADEIGRARAGGYSSDSLGSGHFFAMVAGARPDVADSDTALSIVGSALKLRWASDRAIDTRVAILQALAPSALLATHPREFLSLVREGLGDYTVTARGDVGSHVRLEALAATRALWAAPLDHAGSSSSSSGGGGSSDDLGASVSALFLDVLRLAAEKLDRVRVEARAVLALALAPDAREALLAPGNSAREYFSHLLSLALPPRLVPGQLELHEKVRAALDGPDAPSDGPGAPDTPPDAPDASDAPPDVSLQARAEALLAGLVVSADTGSEDLVMAARDAMCAFAARCPDARRVLCGGLVGNLRRRLSADAAGSAKDNDRVVVPTLEALAHLLRVGVVSEWDGAAPSFWGGGSVKNKTTTLRSLCVLAQKAAYKSGNMRKIEACVRVYGAVASLAPLAAGNDDDGHEGGAAERAAGVAEAKRRLGALLYHPWPKVRGLVVDELWGVFGIFAAGEGGEGGVGGGGGGGGDVDGDGQQAGTAREHASELLKGVDWARAGKETVRAAIVGLEIQ